MSFSRDSKNEIAVQPIKSKCCRRAMLMGLLIETETKDDNFLVDFETGEIADMASSYVSEIFSKECNVVRTVKYGRERFSLSCTSNAIVNQIKKCDSNDEGLLELVPKKCDLCIQNFLKGVFLATGTVNDPQKSYHTELSFSNAVRAEKIDALLAEIGIPARRIERSKKVGLYYKKESDIEDFFAKIGANNIAFEIINSKIEKDIRNNENRATNFVATNIMRSVTATGKQIDAIFKLKKCGRFEFLPDDLKTTAELRLLNDDISISELAQLHTPPISKSGVNHRLTKLVEMAENLKK